MGATISAAGSRLYCGSWRPHPINTVFGAGPRRRNGIPTIQRPDVRHPANTLEDMKKLLLGYRDNMRVEIESDVAVTTKTVADLRALSTWPDGLVLDIYVDLDP